MKKLDKNITQVFPLLEFHTLRYAHNPYNFIAQYSICEVLIFLFHTLPSVIPITLSLVSQDAAYHCVHNGMDRPSVPYVRT